MLANMKTGTKVLLGFIFAVIIAITVGGIGYQGITQLNIAVEEVGMVRLPSIQSLLIISEAQTAVDSAENALLASNLDAAGRKAAYDRFDAAKKRAEDAREIYDPLPQTTEEAAVWKEFVPAWDAWWKDHETYVQMTREYEKAPTPELYEAMSKQALVDNGVSFGKAEDLLNKVVEINQAVALQSRKEAAETASSASTAMFTAIGIGAFVMLALGFFIARGIGKVLKALFAEAQKLSDAAVAGQLDTRGDPSVVSLEFRPIVEGVNATLDAVIGPLNVAAEYIDRIAKGDIPPRITDKYNGDFNEIKNNLNQAIDAVNALVADAKLLTKAAVEGKLDTRADASKHQGDFREIVQGVNATLDAVIGPLNVAAEYIDRIGKGDIPPRITDKYNGDFNEIKNNLNQCIDAVNAMSADAKLLAKAAVEGKLDTRADASKHQGDFREIVQGVNATLDAVIGPLNVAAEYVDRIAKGDIPPKITDKYSGDFNEIKNNLNQAIDAVNALVSDAKLLAKAAVEGKLDTRADATKHQGDFREIVQGVNATLDAVIGPLNVAANYVDKISKGDIPPKITDSYNGDFNAIKNNLNTCIDAVNALVADAALLARAAVEGKLATRADATKHQGDFRKIVQGVDDCLDAVIGPLNVAANYVDKISKGDIPAKITDTYNGDFNAIKNNLNTCVEAVNGLVGDAIMLAKAAVEGRLSTRADATKHSGDFRKIVEGVNETLNAVVNPINEAAKVLEQLAQYDLRARVTGNYQGDHAKIKESLNSTAVVLHDTMAQVAEAVDQLSSASVQIASSSQQVAEGASEQAASLEETSASLEEMSGMTKQNADNTQQAKVLAEGTRGAAEKGSAAMTNMVSSMGKIRAASEGTSQIIKDINEIAFQTNLLALNAAVEAARAGDAGRGFAVVAEEVRNLAGRAKEAAKKTEELIKESVHLAEEGESISNTVGGNLREIVDSVTKVTNIVAEIAIASQEQTRGIDQVNKAVAEMDKVVQTAAANSEESSSAAEELASQSQELASMVGKFQLNRSSSGGFAKRPAANAAAHAQLKRPPAPKADGKKPSNGKGFHMKAEDIIPLENDPDFAEF